jgi:hypothetical protein
MAAKTLKNKISSEEMERRRKRVERANAHNRIEGICRDPESDPIFEAYIRGEIEIDEILPRIQALDRRI